MYSTCHSDESANTGSFPGQELPGEEHHMDGMLLEEPPQPPGLPPPSPFAEECLKATDAASFANVPSICQGLGCSRQAKFGYEGAGRTACAQHRLEAMVLRTAKGCETPNCHRAAFYGFDVKVQAIACGVHKTAGMVDLKHKRCEVVDCVRHRVYGVPGGKARYCSRHKEPGMCNVVSRRCSIEGCEKIPTHVSQEDKKYRVCTSHKVEGMIHVSANRACDAPECSRNPIFGFEGQRNNRCAAHKEEGMVDVKHARCWNEDCSKVAAYAFEGEKPRFCYGHKQAGMLSMKHRRCARNSCTRQPVFGFVGGKAELCSGHKVDGMQNVLDKCCSAPACRKLPTFGPEDGKATACAGHKAPGMVNVRNQRCEIKGCSKQARFGMLGEKPRACLDHTQNTMTELRPAHQGRKKLRISDAGAFPGGATSPAPLPPILSHTEGLASVGMPQSTLPSLAFLQSIHLATSSTLQGVGFDGVSPQEIAPQGIVPQVLFPQGVVPQETMPQEILSGGFSSQGVVSEGFSSQGVMPQAATAQETSQAPTPEVVAVAEGAAGVPFSAALQAVSPNSTGLRSTAMSQAMTTGQPVSTHSIGLQSEAMVSTMSTGQSVSTHSTGLPSQTMASAMTTGQPLSPNSTSIHSTAMSTAMTTGQPVSTHSTGIHSTAMSPAMTTEQPVTTHSTSLQSEAMASVMTTGHPLSPNSTTMQSTAMSTAMTTGHPVSTHSTGLHSTAMSSAMTTEQAVSAYSTGLQSDSMMRTMSTGQHSTGLQSTAMSPAMTTGQPVSTQPTGLQSEASYTAGQPVSTSSTGLQSEAMASTVSTGLVDMPMLALDSLPNAAAPTMQSVVYGSQACQQHKQNGMTYRYGFGSRCRFGGCLEQPQYGFDDEGPRFCAAHKRGGMSDRATASSCEIEDSGGRAMDGLDSPSDGQPYVHQAAAMMGGDAVKMQHQFCVWESCLQPPLYSWSGEDSPRFCEAHASPGMIPPSTGGHPCRYHACLKQACFAFEGEACRFCPEHCVDGMLEAEGRQCHHQGCTGLAPYSCGLNPVKDSYPSLPLSSGSISPVVDDVAPHSMQSHLSHHFSGGQEEHQGMVDAISVSNSVDDSGFLGGGSGSGDGHLLDNEDTNTSHAEEGRQSALLPPSPGQAVGAHVAPHPDEAPEHYPSSFHHQH